MRGQYKNPELIKGIKKYAGILSAPQIAKIYNVHPITVNKYACGMEISLKKKYSFEVNGFFNVDNYAKECII